MTFGVFRGVMAPPFGGGAVAAPAADWWEIAGQTCVAAYAPKGAASLAASYANLAAPGTYAAPGVAPTWDAAIGWQSDGSAWLDTGIIGTTSYTIAVRFSNVGSGSPYAALGSVAFSTDVSILFPRVSASEIRYWIGGPNIFAAYQDVIPAMSSGVLIGHRGYGWRDGTARTTINGTHAVLSNTFAVLGCKDNPGTVTYLFVGCVQEAAIYSTMFDDAAALSLTNNMNAR